MEWDDNVLEENNMLISEWDSESTNDTGQDIEKLGSSIELMVFMDKGEEALVHSLSNHFSSWNQLCIELMKNVLKIISLDRFFGIEKLEELLNELWSDIDLKRSNLNCFVNNQLKEELIDPLEMWPCWVDLILLLDTGLRELKVGLLDIWERSEDVLLDHGHHIVKVGDD